MYAIVIILVLVLAAQVSAFHMASPLTRGKTSSSMKMSLESIPTELLTNQLLTNHNMLLSAAVSTDVDLKTTVLAFLFIAAAIMGSVQDFLKAFDKKPQQ